MPPLRRCCCQSLQPSLPQHIYSRLQHRMCAKSDQNRELSHQTLAASNRIIYSGRAERAFAPTSAIGLEFDDRPKYACEKLVKARGKRSVALPLAVLTQMYRSQVRMPACSNPQVYARGIVPNAGRFCASAVVGRSSLTYRLRTVALQVYRSLSRTHPVRTGLRNWRLGDQISPLCPLLQIPTPTPIYPWHYGRSRCGRRTLFEHRAGACISACLLASYLGVR